MNYLLVLLPALLAYGQNYWNNTIFVKWFVLSALLVTSVGFKMGKRIHWSVVPAYLSTALSALWYLGWRDHQYASFQPSDIFPINKQAGYVLVVLTLGLAFFSSLSLKGLGQMSRAFGLFCLVNTLSIFYYAAFRKEVGFEAGGLLGNASMNGCLIAASYPLYCHLLNKWVDRHNPIGRIIFWVSCLLPWVGCAITGRAAPIVTIAISTVAYCYRYISIKKLAFALLLAIGGGFIFISVTDKTHFFDGSGRLDVWLPLMGEFLSIQHTPATGFSGQLWWFGIGPGLSAALVPHLQQVLSIQTCCGWWVWLHNDWLQLFLEQGLMGVICYAPLVYTVVRHSRRYPELFASVVSFSFAMLVNYPLRLAPGALLAGFLVTYSLKGAKTNA